jgi:AraC-like DNA-binding protein
MHRKPSIGKVLYEAAVALKSSIDSNPLSRASCQELLPETNIARKQILAAFKKITGCNFITYQRHKRMETAAKMLLEGMTIKEVTGACGYNSYVGNFSRDFKAVFSQGPDKWKKDRLHDGDKRINKAISK